jgi:predicted metal-dependent hydrolase
MQAPLPFEEQRQPDLLFVRHPRARRYVIRVTDDNTVRVTIPRWGSKRDARAFVEQERSWILKQQQRPRSIVGIVGNVGIGGPVGIVSPGAGSQAQDSPDAALRERAKRELPARLLELAARHGLQVRKISVRNQKWRWGSCSPRGHICLNWRLIGMPEAVRDYVLIHELMHLKRMDHSPRFWALVAQACPDYLELRRSLRGCRFA